MQNQNVVITGGTDGIGKAAAIQLAKLGARLLLVSRNPDKGEAAIAEIKRVSGNDAVTFLQADLSLMNGLLRPEPLSARRRRRHIAHFRCDGLRQPARLSERRAGCRRASPVLDRAALAGTLAWLLPRR